MDEFEYKKAIAKQVSINDQLMAEIAYVDELLRSVGFKNGLSSLKTVAEDMISEIPGDDKEA